MAKKFIYPLNFIIINIWGSNSSSNPKLGDKLVGEWWDTSSSNLKMGDKLTVK